MNSIILVLHIVLRKKGLQLIDKYDRISNCDM